MTPIAKLLAACVLAGVGAGSAAAAELDLRVRPTLPPEIRTVQQAIAYYLEPAGYSFVSADPTYGDFHDLAARPVARTAPDNQPLAIRDAILAVLPDSVVLYIDPVQQLVKLGRRPASARDVRDRVHLIDAPSTAADLDAFDEMPSSEGFVDIDPSADPAEESIESDVLPMLSPVPTPAVAEAALIAPAAEPETVDGFALPLIAGESLSVQLAKATPPGYQVVWRAPNDLMVGANATITAATFEDAVVEALRALWHTRNALIVTHYTNNVLVITTP